MKHARTKLVRSSSRPLPFGRARLRPTSRPSQRQRIGGRRPFAFLAPATNDGMGRVNGEYAARRPLTGKCGIGGGSLVVLPSVRRSARVSVSTSPPFPSFIIPSSLFRDERGRRSRRRFGIATATVERVKSERVVQPALKLCERDETLLSTARRRDASQSRCRWRICFFSRWRSNRPCPRAP